MKLFLLLFLFWSTYSFSYPENVRLGYTSCKSCHVSPSGGGVLNSYGRGISEDPESSWFYEGEGKPLHGAINSLSWLDIGGDVRAITFSSIEPKKTKSEFLFMQADVEGAIKLPKLTVDLSYGVYEGKDFQSRRHYVMYEPWEDAGVSIRIGRFFPSYGIMTPDHTVLTRRGLGFGEGKESYNTEVAYISKYGEIFATTFATPNTFVKLSEDGFDVYSDKYQGHMLSGSYYLGTKAKVGAGIIVDSSPATKRMTFGPNLSLGVTKDLYILTEADYIHENQKSNFISYSKIGYELFRGFHVYTTMETDYQSKLNIPGVGTQWFPRPHFELMAAFKPIFQAAKYSYSQSLFMLHYNF